MTSTSAVVYLQSLFFSWIFFSQRRTRNTTQSTFLTCLWHPALPSQMACLKKRKQYKYFQHESLLVSGAARAQLVCSRGPFNSGCSGRFSLSGSRSSHKFGLGSRDPGESVIDVVAFSALMRDLVCYSELQGWWVCSCDGAVGFVTIYRFAPVTKLWFSWFWNLFCLLVLCL